MEADRELKDFDGVCRLFPLPEVVLFPHAILPLHIFEPRYRRMTEDALATDRLVAIVRIRPGGDPRAVEDPPIEPVACLGRILDYRRLPDGRFTFLLVGRKRILLRRELPRQRPYRTAEVQILEDRYPDGSDRLLRDELLGLLRRLAAAGRPIDPDLVKVCRRDLPLGDATDLIAHYLGDDRLLPVEIRQGLLAEPRVHLRAAALVEILRSHLAAIGADPGPDDPDYLPAFSSN